MGHAVRCYIVGEWVDSKALSQELRKTFPSLLVQTVDPRTATNEMLVDMLAAQTLEAGRSGSPLAKKPEVDLLMRLGGTTQIARAIEDVGAKRGSGFILIVAGAETNLARLGSEHAKDWVRLPRRSLNREELQRIERAALLNAERA